jgi:hypothetical protein
MADAAHAASILGAGAAFLAPVLAPAGFTFQLACHGRSSGGGFATGRFARGSQYVEFHVRHSLGLVTYGWDDTVISHPDYLRGLRAVGAYPGYSVDPMGGFRHLARDLTGPLAGFVNGDREGYERGVQASRQPLGRYLP